MIIVYDSNFVATFCWWHYQACCLCCCPSTINKLIEFWGGFQAFSRHWVSCYLTNIYELISVCPWRRNMRVFLETAYSSQTKLIGLNLHVSEHGIGYSNLTPDPQGTRGGHGGQNSSFTKPKNFANKSCQAW